MSKLTIETPYLEFKFLKNATISLGDGRDYHIPTTMKAQPNPYAQRDPRMGRSVSLNDPDAMITMPYFDMDHVHKAELKNERPIVPKKLAGMSDAHHAKLCDQAYERAAQAKVFNDSVRARVNAYVRDGVLEIVNDPFEGEEEVEGLAELAEAYKSQSEETSGEESPTPRKAAKSNKE